MRFLRFTLLWLALISTPLVAQTHDDDRGFIAGLLEDALGGEGRTVRIEGFAGALSSTATVARITIADPDGVWLALDGVTLEWTRSALLQGRIDIQTLAADQITLARLPQAAPQDNVPAPEATVFRLPDLPVSVQIDSLAANRILLGAPVLGEAAELTLSATIALADGDGSVSLQARRLDGATGQVSLVGRFANADEALTLDLTLEEAAGGLVARALDLPGAPPVSLQVVADGTLSDMTGDLRLASDGVDRLTGNLTIATDASDLTRFAADLGGDLTPLLDAGLHPIFGRDSRLVAEGTRAADGLTTVDTFRLTTAATDLQGQVTLSPAGWPTRAQVTGQVATVDGTPLIIPSDTGGTRLGSARVDLRLGAAGENLWSGQVTALGLDTGTVGFAQLDLSGTGTLDPEARTLNGMFDYGAQGFAPADPALLEALGAEFGGQVRVNYAAGTPLQIADLVLQTRGLGLFGDVVVGALADGLPVDFDLRVQTDDFARFAGLAGQPLGGAGEVSVTGDAALGGLFDVQITGQTRDLTIGVPQADTLFAGRGRLRADLRRDETGVLLRDLTMQTDRAQIAAQGRVSSLAGDLQLDVTLQDLADLLPDYAGPAQAVGRLGFDRNSWTAQFDVDSPLANSLSLSGQGGIPQGDALTRAEVDFDLTGPVIPDAALARAVGDSLTGRVEAQYSASRLEVPVLRITAGDLVLSAQASLPDLAAPYDTRFELEATADSLTRFADLAGLPLRGGAQIKASGQASVRAGDLRLDVTLEDLAAFLPDYAGAAQLLGTLTYDPDRWQARFDVDSPLAEQLRLSGQGGMPQADTLTGAEVDFDLTGPVIRDAALAQAVGDQVTGRIEARYSKTRLDVPLLRLTAGDLALNGQSTTPALVAPFASDFNLVLDARRLSRFADLAGLPLRGAAQVSVAGQANATGDITAAVTGDLNDIGIGQAQVDALMAGATRLVAQMTRQGQDFALRDASLANAQARVTAQARRQEGTTEVSLTADLPRVAVVAAGVPGALSLTADLRDAGQGWQGTARFSGPYASQGQVQADLTGDARISFDAGLPDVGQLGAPFGGPLTLVGRVTQEAGAWSTRTDVTGPGGTSALLTGALTPSLDLRAVGDLPLALFTPLVAPRNIAGQAAFDLALAGPPALSSVTGQVRISNTTVVSPTERLSLRDIAGTAALANGRATLDLAGQGLGGGTLRLTGPLTLDSGLNADLQVALDRLEVTDPQLYRTRVNGTVNIAGPLTGGGRITGNLTLGETNISVPNTFLGGLSPLPDVTHIGATRPVMRTQQKAGVGSEGADDGPRRVRRPFDLDIRIAAPARVFVRGRGLDAELGGDLRVTGTTNAIVSSGGVELIRGRLDILGQRFVVDEGRVQLLGDFDPYLRFVANTETDTGSVSVVLDGRASSPDVSFVSVPSLPEDEVLAQLLFGKDLRQLSALQALELANAVATLAGRGGRGLVGRLRDSFDLDDLDITSDEEGNTQLRAGKYITENVYTDVTVGQDSRPEVSINIDLTKDITARGRLGSDGETSLGVFFERDY